MKRVAVIGAGPSGLLTTRRLAEKSDKFDFITFESSENIGGVWNYTDKRRKDFSEHEHNTACIWYDMTTNNSTPLLTMPGHEWPTEAPSFPSRADISKYVQEFADKFNSRKFIRTSNAIEKVRPLLNDDRSFKVWEITIKDVKAGTLYVEHFDAVMDCRGRFGEPRIPKIPGLDKFPGTAIHSDDFRKPEEFTGKRVLVVGLSLSGQDLVAIQFNRIYCDLAWSIKPRGIYKATEETAALKKLINDPTNKIYPGIKCIKKSQVVFDDDSRFEADVIVFGSGYSIERPYLHPECKVEIDDRRVESLYKFIFNVHYPNMMFVGITYSFLPFVSSDYQARCALKVLEGAAVLPDKKTMLKDIQRDYELQLKTNGNNRNYTMYVGSNCKSYHDELAEVAGLEPMDSVVHIGADFLFKSRKSDFVEYKKYEYIVLNKDKIIFKKDGNEITIEDL